MKGTIFDFLTRAAERPDVAKELAELAAKHDFEFSDEVGDKELETIAGGADLASSPQLLKQPSLLSSSEFDGTDQETNQSHQSLSRILRTMSDLGDTGAAGKSGL
jgi:hypothetical protein